MPFARCYIRRSFDDMTRRPRESRASRNGNRCRLSHQSIRDLQMWRKLASTETDGGPTRPLPIKGIMDTDAADVGFGGTLDVAGNPGDPGQWQNQGIWEMKGQSRGHFGQGTQGNSCSAHSNAGRTREEGRNIFIEALRRQLECRARDKLLALSANWNRSAT
jgi:hypothetical protein